MKRVYLEVAYRKGKPIAAYYYLPRKDGDRSARTERADGGLVVDYSSDQRPIGIEITSQDRLNLSVLNRLLASLGQPSAAAEELGPLAAA